MGRTPAAANRSRACVWLGVGLPAVIVVVSFAPVLLFWSRLPDRVASHFDGAGRADGSMAIEVFFLVTSSMVFIGLGLAIGTARRQRSLPAGSDAMAGFLGPFIAALGGGLMMTTAVSQRDIDDWTDAPNVWWSLPVVLAGAVTAGIVGARLGSRLSAGGDAAALDAPIMDLGRGEQAVWTASVRSTPLLLSGLASVIGGVVLGVAMDPWSGLVILACALPLMTLAQVRVRVDRVGLRVTYGWLPWPRTSLSVDRIDVASVIDVRPSHWGGWGYRGSLKLADRAAVVLRAGPGIRLDLTNGKVFVVTIDDPDTGVALLNAQVRRRVDAL